jgi:hypothetical protein
VLPLLGRLGGLLGHENALYVRPGVGIPEVTLVTQPDAPAQGMATLDQLVAGIGIAGAAKPVTIGTTKAKMIDLGRISIYYGVAGGKLLVTNQQQAFQDLTSGGSKLSGDATYKEALAAAAMPAATNGFLYVNLKDSVPLIETLAGLGGSQIPADVGANLRPLRTAVAWATAGDNEGSLSVFLEIK